MGKKVAREPRFTFRQEQFLNLVTRETSFKKNFYLTGGTALSAIYYNHRESLDVDLFSQEKFSSAAVLEFLNKAKKNLGLKSVRRRADSGNDNYILTFSNGDTLHVDFELYTFGLIKKGPTWGGLRIDSLEDIATNKLNTILLRKNARDYVDLYFLMRREKFTIKHLRKNMSKKFDWEEEPMSLSKHLLVVRELKDYPKMKVKFSKSVMIEFFENEAMKLNREIFK